MIFGNHANPAGCVRGVIHPSSWDRPAGNHDPRLVRGYLGTNGSIHDGLDISTGDYGRPVLAAAAGKVIWAKVDGGLYVVIDHAEPYRTLYGHLLSESVSVGQHVEKGQQIGKIGYSGTVYPPGPPGSHLHFEVFLDSTKRINPWPLLFQNVKVKVKSDPDGVRIRTAPELGGSFVYASTKNGRLIREDGKDLGATNVWRRWDGNVTGDSYKVGITPSDKWRKIWLDGRWLYVAALLSSQSAT